MNDQRPVVSAIVTSYFGRDFLHDCLTTLARDLGETPHEIIVVDNGSTDGSVDLIRRVCPGAKLISHNTNLGFAKAVNVAIGAASGEFLFVLNQDIRIRPGCTSRLLKRVESDQSIGMIGPKFVGFDGKLQYSARAFPSYKHIIYMSLFLDRLFPRSREFGSWEMTWFDHMTEMEVDQPMGAAMLIPRRVIDKVGLMDESFPIYFNDVDFCRRVKTAGFKLIYFPEAVIEHLVGGSTRRQPVQMIIQSHLSLYHYLQKYARPVEYPLLWLCRVLLVIGIVPRVVIAALSK